MTTEAAISMLTVAMGCLAAGTLMTIWAVSVEIRSIKNAILAYQEVNEALRDRIVAIERIIGKRDEIPTPEQLDALFASADREAH